jgi:release factor glutamine methyltransferase
MEVRLDRLIDQASTQLMRAGIPEPEARWDAQLLAADAFLHVAPEQTIDVNRVRVWTALQEDISKRLGEQVFRAFQQEYTLLIDRRAAREPLQWIEGSAAFRGLTLHVGPGVFIPRPETELVAGAAIQWLKSQISAHSDQTDQRSSESEMTVVDLCAGSGAIGLSIATEVPGVSVICVENDPTAVRWLNINAQMVRDHSPSSSVRVVIADATSEGLCDQMGIQPGSVECVISNPPYVPENEPVTQPEAARDPAHALYGGSADGLKIPYQIVEQAARLLQSRGLCVMEHDISQGQALRKAFRDAGLTHVRTCEDGTHRPRWTQGEMGTRMGRDQSARRSV